MKLALVRQRYTPFGGAERFMERALTALRASGTDVSVIARAWPGGERRDDFMCCDPFYLGRTWRDAGFARAVQELMRGGSFDLIQSHERIPGCQIYRAGDGVHATWLELRARIHGPLSRIATELQPWHRYTLGAEAAMFRHPALRAVICNSHMVREDIARRFGVVADKLHVIHNGVDLEFFTPALRDMLRGPAREAMKIGPTDRVVLFVGSGFERKGLAPLLDAFAALQRKDAHLVIVGRDRHGADFRRRAIRLGIAARTHFAGGQDDVRPYYAAADVFALPTLYDPFPNAALEALACGLPVLTSTTSGAAELIRNGENGFVADALDVKTLAEQLRRVLDSAHTMSEAARAAAETLPMATTADRLLALYRQLLESERL